MDCWINQKSIHYRFNLWSIIRKFLCEVACRIKNFKKGLINIKNNGQKCFLLCHVRRINPGKIHPERITWEDKKLANDLDYDRVKFPVQEKDFSKTEKKNNISVNVFCYENRLTFPSHISNQKFENSMDILLITDGYKLHYVYNMTLTFTFHKTNNKNKK